MDAEGLDFTCGTCHKTSSHDVAGSRYTPTAKDDKGVQVRGKAGSGNPATCVACHDNAPHKKEARLNQHATKIACQTCHIPTYARGGIATKMTWDWSTAGKRDGRQAHRAEGRQGPHHLRIAQGRLHPGRERQARIRLVQRQRAIHAAHRQDREDRAAHPINKMGGSPTDGKSMIWPMKVFRGSQPYDPVNKTLITPHTAGNDDTGYWKNLDWDKAVATGMKDSGAPWSGKVDFIKTEMSWPITTWSRPRKRRWAASNATQGRPAGRHPGRVSPARDNNKLVDTAGWAIVLLTLLGVIGHGALRIVTAAASLKEN
jgi:hypothetical protein